MRGNGDSKRGFIGWNRGVVQGLGVARGPEARLTANDDGVTQNVTKRRDELVVRESLREGFREF